MAGLGGALGASFVGWVSNVSFHGAASCPASAT